MELDTEQFLHDAAANMAGSTTVRIVSTDQQKHRPICLPQGLASKQDPESGAIVFAYGLFDEKRACTEDVKLCVCSWCCVNIQWANNVSNSQMKLFSSFWFALVVSTLNSYQLALMTRGISYLLWVSAKAAGKVRSSAQLIDDIGAGHLGLELLLFMLCGSRVQAT